MTTTYTDVQLTYGFTGTSVGVSIDPRGIVYSEADLDTAIQAFADSLNASGNGPTITQVTKTSSQAVGYSDWSYEPTV